MSMPSSCITTAASMCTGAGCVPAEETSNTSPASCRISASAIWLRAEFPEQTTSTRLFFTADPCATGLPGRSHAIPKERLHAFMDLVANAAERSQALLFAALDCRWVFEAPVNPLAACRKHRAVVPRVIADGHHVFD